MKGVEREALKKFTLEIIFPFSLVGVFFNSDSKIESSRLAYSRLYILGEEDERKDSETFSHFAPPKELLS